MRSAFLLSCAAYAALVAGAAAWLPERVPLHFAASGEPDRWGSRTEALVTFGLLGLGLAVLLGGMAALTRRLPLRSAWVNLPHKDWWTATPEREARARRRLERDGWAVAATTMAFLCLVLLVTVGAARSDRPALGWPFMVVVGLLLVAGLAWGVWTATVRYRPEEER